MSAETEELVALGIDIEKDVPCEWPKPPCDKPGAWRVWHPCCGLLATLCDDHRIEEDVWAQVTQGKGNRIFCLKCNGVLEDYKYIRL